jgi:hypothetical protein
MAIEHPRFEIGLTIPVEAREQLLSCARMVERSEELVRAPTLNEFCVRLMSIEAQSGDDIAKIQRAFDAVKERLQGQDCSAHTGVPCVCQNRTALAFYIQTSSVSVRGVGYLRHLVAVLYSALREQGITSDHMTTPEECTPHVVVVRVASQQAPFTSDAPKLLPSGSFVQWRTSAQDLFVKEEGV